jgi:alpha-tubulin suppressor-like RCC1 family protein
MADGTLDCWGLALNPIDNALFSMSTQVGRFYSLAPTTVAGFDNVFAVAAGLDEMCAIVSGGRVTCLGTRPLGNGTNLNSATRVWVSNLNEATSIAVGDSSGCAVALGSVWCWGDNSRGQLGNGTTMSSDVPVAVVGLGVETPKTGGADAGIDATTVPLDAGSAAIDAGSAAIDAGSE